MQTTADVIILIGSCSLSMFIIYLIDNGMPLKLQLLFLAPSIISLPLLLFINFNVTYKRLNIGLVTTPIVIVALYNIFNLVSWKLHDREFRLIIRGARHMKYYDNYKPYKISDTIFSLLLLLTTMLWPVAIAVGPYAFFHDNIKIASGRVTSNL